MLLSSTLAPKQDFGSWLIWNIYTQSNHLQFDF